MEHDDRGFWRQLFAGIGSALARMFLTSLALAIVGAVIGGVGGFFVAGGIGALIGAGAGAVLLGAGWFAFYAWVMD